MTLAKLSDRDVYARARAAHDAGDWSAMEQWFGRLHRKQPRNYEYLYYLGVARARLGRRAAGRKLLREALTRKRDLPEAWYEIAGSYANEGRVKDAHEANDRALSMRPGFPAFVAQKASFHRLEGDAEAGYALLRPLIESREADHNALCTFAGICRTLDRCDEALGPLEGHVDREDLSPQYRRTALFMLSELLNATGEHDRAFEAAMRANATGGSPFAAMNHSQAVDRVIEAWTPEVIESLPRSGETGEWPIFIVGMMRSGTSLVEQILASHPAVHGAGERPDVGRAVEALRSDADGSLPMITNPADLTRRAVDRAAREITRSLRRLAPEAERITDKSPQNFLRLGPIRCFLPRARIIHTVRDPLDACVSNFLTDFAEGLPMTSDLRTLGRFYRDYERLMEHWRRVLDLPMLEVPCEELVRDQEPWIRRIVDFAGLEWDDAPLRFHETDRVLPTASVEQVRKPVYTSSIGRWRRYERHLDPLREALER